MNTSGTSSTAHYSDAQLAAVLLAIDPGGLGGAILKGTDSVCLDQWLKAFRDAAGGITLRKIPGHAGLDRLIGGLDLSATLTAGRPILERGLLAQAHEGVVVLPSAERVGRDKAAVLASALDLGQISVQRDGLSATEPARFALVACDEGLRPEESTPQVIAERLAFQFDLDEMDALVPIDPLKINAAQRRLLDVTVPASMMNAICSAAMALGIKSLRVPLFAMKAIRALAAYEECDLVTDEHATIAARLVLAPRAKVIPQTESEAAERPEQDQQQMDGTDQDSASAVKPLSDVVLDAVKAALPQDLLSQLIASQATRMAGRAGQGALALRNRSMRGRSIGTRTGELRRGASLNILATLRAAAPWQRLRQENASTPKLIKIRREDFRVNRFAQRNETTAIFAVDASGSAALHRLSEAKGAVEIILSDCYVRRDRAALLTFRGKTAEVLLPPTRSLERARRSLAAMPGGGGTPLSMGIETSLLVADQVRRGGGTPVLVFLTDGRANIARDGTANRIAASNDALAAARLVRAGQYKSLVIDISHVPSEVGRTLAHEMGATYLPLPHAGARHLSQTISDAIAA